MNNNCWYDVKINLEDCLRPDFEFPDVNEFQTNHAGWTQLKVWYKDNHEVFNPEWLEYMKSIGYPIGWAILFYRVDPGIMANSAHIDMMPDGTKALHGINWVYGGKDSQMIWAKDPDDTKKLLYSPANTPIVSWDPHSLEEIDRVHVGMQPKLVRVDTPHYIDMGDEPRFCISTRRSLKVEPLSWEETIELFRKNNLLVEREDAH